MTGNEPKRAVGLAENNVPAVVHVDHAADGISGDDR
jgi:hypothetical protein